MRHERAPDVVTVETVRATKGAVTDNEIIDRIRRQGEASSLPPPAPAQAVAEFEAAVGAPMPRLLKRIYVEVADGGFGRGGEALSLTDTTYSFSDSPRLVREYRSWSQRPHHPPTVVPLLTWGCAIWSFVDYSTDDGQMWAWDPHVRCLEHALFAEHVTVAQRLMGWLDGIEDFPRPSSPISDCPRCDIHHGASEASYRRLRPS